MSCSCLDIMAGKCFLDLGELFICIVSDIAHSYSLYQMASLSISIPLLTYSNQGVL